MTNEINFIKFALVLNVLRSYKELQPHFSCETFCIVTNDVRSFLRLTFPSISQTT